MENAFKKENIENKKDANRNGSFELRMNDFIMKRIR